MLDIKKIFNEHPFEYNSIITSIFIGGLLKEDINQWINNHTTKPRLSCLFSIPHQNDDKFTAIPFDFIYPDNNYVFSITKFFSMTFTNEKGIKSYIYCIKLSEEYPIDKDNAITLPLVIGVKSYKSDIDAFKGLFEGIYSMINKETVDSKENYTPEEVLNYKRVELMNIISFCTMMIKPSSHSNIQLNIGGSDAEMKDNIDFYYCSNCEIPCNKNDSDIKLLFDLLDIDIIIKVLIAILSERQIIIIASEVSILYMLFPAFLKLIFPFKWIHPYIPLLPPEQYDFLDAPVSYFFGIESKNVFDPKIADIINKDESKVIVYCDTNEIINFKEFKPYYSKPSINPSENLLYFNKSDVFAYDLNTKTKKPKDFPKEISKIIIDCRKAKVYIDERFKEQVDEDIKTLKRGIQVSKNPDIYSLDQLSGGKNKINIDKTFSYNIQRIFFEFYQKKIEKFFQDINDPLVEVIKETNLFENFIKGNRFSNSSLGAIYANIAENISKSSIDNCYEVIYNLPEFPIKKLMSVMKEKEIKKERIERILYDYAKVKGIKMDGNINRTSEKCFQMRHVNSMTGGGVQHLKNKKSQLQMSRDLNFMTFTQMPIEFKGEPFFFYQDKGFIAFINDFYDLMSSHSIPLNDICYHNQITSKIIEEAKTLSNYDKWNENKEEDNASSEPITFDIPITNATPMINKHPKQLGMIGEEEDANSNNDSCHSYRETKHMNNTSFFFYEEDNDIIKIKGNANRPQHYLFHAYYLETLKTKPKLLEPYNLNNSIIDEIIIQLYCKAYSFNSKEFPLYHFCLFIQKYIIDNHIDTNPFTEEEKDLRDLTECYLRKEAGDTDKIRAIGINHSKSVTNYKRFRSNTTISVHIDEINSTVSSPDANKSPSVKDVIPFEISLELLTKNNTDKSMISTEKMSYEYKTSTSSSGFSNAFNFNDKIIINNSIDFQAEGKPLSLDLIKTIGCLIDSFLQSITSSKDIDLSNEVLIDRIHESIAIDSFKELIAELNELDLSTLVRPSEKLSFWINCFNYLLLFTIFYKKWIITTQNDWRNFFRNVYYRIGKIEVSFNDMQYIIMNHLVFFEQDHKKNSGIASQLINKSVNNRELLMFMMYIPTGILLPPKIIEENDINNKGAVNFLKEYLGMFIRIDKDAKVIYVPELITIINKKWAENYEKYFNAELKTAFVNKYQKKKVKVSWIMDLSILKNH